MFHMTVYAKKTFEAMEACDMEYLYLRKIQKCFNISSKNGQRLPVMSIVKVCASFY